MMSAVSKRCPPPPPLLALACALTGHCHGVCPEGAARRLHVVVGVGGSRRGRGGEGKVSRRRRTSAASGAPRATTAPSRTAWRT